MKDNCDKWTPLGVAAGGLRIRAALVNFTVLENSCWWDVLGDVRCWWTLYESLLVDCIRGQLLVAYVVGQLLLVDLCSF